MHKRLLYVLIAVVVVGLLVAAHRFDFAGMISQLHRGG